MMKVSVIGAVAITASVVAQAAPASFCDPTADWRQDWVEEFDGDALDMNSWNIHDDNDVGSCREAWCTPNNVEVVNGTLILTSKLENYKGFNYTSAAVYTQGKKAWAGNSTSAFRLCVSAMLPGENASCTVGRVGLVQNGTILYFHGVTTAAELIVQCFTKHVIDRLR